MRTFPFVKQRDMMDCGVTCLSMVCRYYNRSVSIQYLRERSQTGRQGANLLGLSEAAEGVGLRTKLVRLSFHSLVQDCKLPVIVHWDKNHFVVLYKADSRRLYVADPAKCLIKYSAAEFKEHWAIRRGEDQEEGIALLLEPGVGFSSGDADGASPGENERNFKDVYKYVRPYRKLVLQLFIGLAVSSLLQLFLPFLTQSIVDVGIGTSNKSFIYIVLLAQIALLFGRLIVEFIRGWILLYISSRLNVSILTDFLIKLMKLPISFFDSKQAGDVMQRMNDHQRIESFLTGSSLNVLFSLVSLVILSSVLFVFNAGILLIFFIGSILYAGWVLLFFKRRRLLDYKQFDVSSKEQSATIQLVLGMQEIKLHDCERSMRWNWEGLQAKIFKLKMKILNLNQVQQSGAFFINEGKNIFITFLSARSVIDGHMTLGAMLAVQYIIGQLNSPIEQMISFAQNWQNARISYDRLNEIHAMSDEEPAGKHFIYQLPRAFQRQLAGGAQARSSGYFMRGAAGGPYDEPDYSSENGRSVRHADAAIKVMNVSFTYPGAGNEAVLRNINLVIPKGRTTAIVGISGSGKTTLLKLLLKFYEPQKGEICLEGEHPYDDVVALSTISHKIWRKHCGVVMQDSYIFSESIAKNIAVGEEDIDPDRLRHAVSIANVKEFIDRLPLGFDTKIGMEGIGISMGQKQRILIARAVYKNPDFIFLDEATNSLDASNESTIIHNLESFFKGRTVVVVAHRLSTVRHADQIVLLNKGVITERGSHHELISLKGEYYSLVKDQLELGE